ncbi:phosphoenolpyruvate--protein phosphotransferase [Ferrimonas aestuarii]|uniref:phosphoenolpyruvate--protein phosphotransferase n=1 Tax=Ferrimonas aestuarii TaxID=2569539 RepID=A0A4U1BN13_9GAMM|nr:phosphoenolpyruvate--protein phosphotransferase [Ferrimonas aestuarii]TKB55297.1 phosphoenolpyruvate--protein phosphotransferase [Ferrimonas aestuarii]
MITTLRSLVQRVAEAETVEQSMTVLVQQTRFAMNTDCCSLYLVDGEGLILKASDGLAPQAVGRAKLQPGEGIVGMVMRREEPINLADAPSHPSFKRLPEVEEDDFKSFLATPITHRSKVLGVLVVQQKVARQFNEDEEAFLVTLASQLVPELRESQQSTTLSQSGPRRWSAQVASTGIADATILLARPRLSLEQPETKGQGEEKEWLRLERALLATQDEMASLSSRLSGDLETQISAIFDIYQYLIADPVMQTDLMQGCDQGWSAETVVSKVFINYIARFEAMTDHYLKERASDLKDLGERILGQLSRPGQPGKAPKQPVILVAKEITATMLAEVPRDKLAGIVSVEGGSSSHAAILARAMSIPALFGVEGLPMIAVADKRAIVDAVRGQLLIEPTETVAQEFLRFQSFLAEKDAKFEKGLSRPSYCQDGQHIQLMINAGLVAEGEQVDKESVAGIGLYRSETLYMIQDHFPTEQTQERAYGRILKALGDKPVTVRTLDIGGDKPLSYFPIREENPFLGWRGIRLTLDHPELFLVQVKAMQRANIGCGNLRILLPMVSSVDEVKQAKRLIEQARIELQEEFEQAVPPVAIGVMIEVPAVIYLLPQLAKLVDFYSVGSNDLTQYLLAVDRNNAQVADRFDHYHPAVIAALAQIVANNHDAKSLSVCGEIAGEPEGALILLALGYQELSMNRPSLGRIHHLVRHLNYGDLAQLKVQLLQAETSAQVVELAQNWMHQLGLQELYQVD